ncbi:alpha/beta hydrolase [Mycobacterium sp. 21AC1]|uniref:alpha/beta fold hydrolase n=1 Tax=[Mycobacterium] appelbergii TaxID=2939269 RepID=UPI002938EE09|nr:alpha/beta hydrolase [Mycobacterium sp. 21AC1]MDV3123653.1 alpha/beta hydrolase [Mycobacterium sp. 21AC1]
MDSPTEYRTLAVDGVRSPVLLAGPVTDTGETVVFVHGNNAGGSWDPLPESVSSFARVIAPEMPGFGTADKPAEWPYTVAAYAAHLDGLLRQLDARRVHLVAHDFGGPWALAWAAGHLDAVASITLIDTPVVINHFAAKVWRTPVLAEALFRIAHPALLRRMLAARDPGLPTEAVEAITRHMLVPETARAVLKLYRSTGPNAIAPYADQLSAFRGDVLIVWGTDDRYVPLAQADDFSRIFTHTVVHPVRGAGHWPWLEQPDQVAGHLTDFLRRQWGQRP